MSAVLPGALPEDGLALRQRTIAVLAITISAVLMVLDVSMLQVGLPSIAEQLAIAPDMAVWVVNASQLTSVVSMLPMAVLAERAGHARAYRWGLGLYVLGACICWQSSQLSLLLSARVLQGLGAAAVMGAASALLRASYPARAFGTGVSINTTAVTLAAATGPSLGAWVLAYAQDWHSLFAVGLLPGALAWLCASQLPSTARRDRPLAWPAVLCSAVALGGGVWALGMLPKHPLIGIVGLVVAVGAGLCWLLGERRASVQLLPWDLFAAPLFRFAVAASTVMFAAQAAALVALPFYLHQRWGLTIGQTGLLLTAWPLAAALTSTVAIRLARAWSVAQSCMAAAACLVVAMLWVQAVPLSVERWWLLPGLALGGWAVGLFQAPNMQAMLLSVPKPRAGSAGSVQALARVGGSTLGVALTGLCLALEASEATSAALCVVIGLAVAAGLINWRRYGHAAQ